jgi:hypothetical protein
MGTVWSEPERQYDKGTAPLANVYHAVNDENPQNWK